MPTKFQDDIEDTELMRARLAMVVKKILLDRDLSQEALAKKYLDVSQACVRDYVGGEKTSPNQIRMITMLRISRLYGTTVDDLYYYLTTGRWKRRITSSDVEGYIRATKDPKILVALSGLIQSLLEEYIDNLPVALELKEFNPCQRIVDKLEEEKAKVDSSYQWEAMLRAFGISEEEIDDLYSGILPDMEMFIKLSNILRIPNEDLHNMIIADPNEKALTETEEDSEEDVESDGFIKV
jgi:predicted XRE-type DNA-binding protein